MVTRGRPVRQLGTCCAEVCSLLTAAEVDRMISRGRKIADKPEDLPVPNGSACYYSQGAQILRYSSPKSQSDLDALLKVSRLDTGTRQPVSGVGDKAYIMFPAPRDRYQDKAAFLVTRFGQHALGICLLAKNPGETPQST
jgi:hypothetical protein